MADAVQHAHERGILHRDVKPENIMMAGGPERVALIPRLSDFGLAKLVDGDSQLTRSGVLIGTPSYMAPEQAGESPVPVGPASDVYALGAILYELMTGRPPYRGPSVPATLDLVRSVAPVAPSRGRRRDLETICLKCLAKEPSRRFETAGALADDLGRFLRGEPIHARPASFRSRAIKWARRRPMHAAALVLAILAASGLIGGIVYRDVLLERHARELEREVTRADANARLARRHLRAFQLRQAREVLDAGQVERAQDILAAIQADRHRSDLRHDPVHLGFAWHYLNRLARRDLVVLSDRQAERVGMIALSPDGGILATGDEDGTIRLRDPETGRVRATLSGHRLPVRHAGLCAGRQSPRLEGAWPTACTKGRGLSLGSGLARTPGPPGRTCGPPLR